MRPAKRSEPRANGVLEGLFWLLRGPFPVPRAQRSVGASVAIVLFPASYVVWWLTEWAAVRQALVLAIFTVMLGAFFLFLERRNRAPLTTGAVACGIWVTGTMHLAQAAFILATGTTPHRAIPREVVPRVTAIWPFLVAMGFWGTGSVLWLRNERRSEPQREDKLRKTSGKAE